MQKLGIEFMTEIKKEKMKVLENELKEYVAGAQVGEMIECPVCHYVSKNKRFSCKVFPSAIKCFACGLWRSL